ncbi:hypothetical protein TSUD_297200 [Trifolium subterraneum]|uniref:Reverse transcriptase zinc-binding domain-containing protein n=1 Tax=Trifolium subterraneum TaxID=3900 RepID=A0A2Z6N829_TRISU|nr:hypothetical protein TSUD_297200 [Trifolium subterraneum]
MKTSWINWKTICLRKEYGGLWVRQLREFNLALLGKSCWRMLVDREGLWFRVLAARYGMERGSLRAGGRRRSSWWREIASIRDGGGGIGEGGLGSTCRKRWEMGHILFSRLILGWMGFFCASGLAPVRLGRDQIGFGDGDVCTRVGSGRRGAGFSDRWLWQPDSGIGYSVRGAYQLLTSQDSVTLDAEKDLIWHGQIPLKVFVVAWRLLGDILPTKANLVARGILSWEAHHCVSGCGAVESTQHLFLSYSTLGSHWSLVSSWIGSSFVEAQTLSYHFVQFTSSAGGSRVRRSFM